MTVQEAKEAMQNLYHITERAALFSLSYGSFGNTRKIRAEKDEDENGVAQAQLPGMNAVTVKTDADKDWLKVSKQLLASPELDDIRKSDAAIYQWLLKQTLPFDGLLGVKFMPYAMLPKVIAKLKEHETERLAKIETFLTNYYQLCIEAKQRLGSLYNPRDYPDSATLRARFYFEWGFAKIEVPEHLQTISKEWYAEEVKKTQDKMNQAAQDILLFMRVSLAELVTDLQAKLEPDTDGKTKRLHSSAITNLQEFLATFQFRNIVNDTELDKLAAKLQSIVKGLHPDQLRGNEENREYIHDKMKTIGAQLTALVEKTPGRKFR